LVANMHKFENLNYQQLPVGEENELPPVNWSKMAKQFDG
jgi:hypothetical protein